MNIFVTSDDPYECARNLDDKRVIKMILESAQMLSTAMHELGIPGAPYKKTHVNHPCSVWARQSRRNYFWLLEHMQGLCMEYKHRYNKTHKCANFIHTFFNARLDVPSGDLTPFANCSKFKDIETKLAYKLTMISKWTTDEENKRPPKWTNRSQPDWLLP